jgi:hypothetical protein
LTWQPLAGWQTNTPVAPYGAHNLLQQLPQPAQTVPSTAPEQLLAPEGGTAQVPMLAPCAIVQVPEQQSALLEHVSPLCTQNDEPS